LVVIPTVYASVDRIFGSRRGRAPRVLLHEELEELNEEQLAPEDFSGQGEAP
jgi:hypothetical protein